MRTMDNRILGGWRSREIRTSHIKSSDNSHTVSRPRQTDVLQLTDTSETASDKTVDDCWYCGIKTSNVQHSWVITAGQLEMTSRQSTHHQPEHTDNPGEQHAQHTDKHTENTIHTKH